VTPEQAAALGLGRIPGLEKHIRPYLNGPRSHRSSRNVMVIDLFGLSSEQVQRKFPEVYQRNLRLSEIGAGPQSARYLQRKMVDFRRILDLRFAPRLKG